MMWAGQTFCSINLSIGKYTEETMEDFEFWRSGPPLTSEFVMEIEVGNGKMNVFHQQHLTSVIQEEPKWTLNAAEESIDDHIIDVLHVGLPFLWVTLGSEKLQVSLRHEKMKHFKVNQEVLTAW